MTELQATMKHQERYETAVKAYYEMGALSEFVTSFMGEAESMGDFIRAIDMISDERWEELEALGYMLAV